jgi:hypothetical protein
MLRFSVQMFRLFMRRHSGISGYGEILEKNAGGGESGGDRLKGRYGLNTSVDCRCKFLRRKYIRRVFSPSLLAWIQA